MRIAARMATQRGLGLFAAETRGVQSSRATVEAGQPRWWLGMCSGSTSEQPDRLARGMPPGTSQARARPATRFWGVNRGQRAAARCCKWAPSLAKGGIKKEKKKTKTVFTLDNDRANTGLGAPLF